MSLFSKKETVKLDVTGMHCQKCVARVTAALEGVEGVTGVTVDLDGASAVVEGHSIDTTQLITAVEAIEFGAKIAD